MDLLITTEDNEHLAFTQFGDKPQKGVLLIAPAMGVSRKFYAPIANYFAERGYTVITFDYRGIGDSSKVNNPSNCTLYNWGSRDLRAIIGYASLRFQDQPLYLLGHSISGQVLAFADNHHLINKAFFVASQNVSKYNWSGLERFLVQIFWHLVVPLSTTFLGGLSGFAYGGRETIPKRIARDWATWGKNRKGAQGAVPNANRFYQNLKMPAKFISFSDDNLLSPKKATQVLFESYGSPIKEHIHIEPHQYGMKKIGHFKFFRKGMEMLWEEVHDWFDKHSDSFRQQKLA